MNDFYVFFYFLLLCVPFILIWLKLFRKIKQDLENLLHYCFWGIASLIAFDLYFIFITFIAASVLNSSLGNILAVICYLVNIYSIFLIAILIIVIFFVAIIKFFKQK